MTGRKTTAWEIASDAEQVVVLWRLLDRHPELRAEADQLVLTVLEAVERSDVADDVSTALESVSTAVVGAHSGRQRGRGYVEASDAAWELLAAAVDPFVVRLRQLVDLGLRDAATRWAPASSWVCLRRAATTDAPSTLSPTS